MISNDLFCKTITAIQEQGEINDNFSKALQTVGDGHFVFGTDNKYYYALMNILVDIFKDDGEWISWWLYEEVEKVVWLKDGSKIRIDTPGQLYDFLLQNIAEKESVRENENAKKPAG